MIRVCVSLLFTAWAALSAVAQSEPPAPVLSEPPTDRQADPETVSVPPDPVMLPARPDTSPRSSDPIEALSETAETATVAASEFLNWLGSGQHEALLALSLVIALSGLLWVIRWRVTKDLGRLTKDDNYSILAVARRLVKRFHLYFMFAVALALTDWVMLLPEAVSGFVSIYFVVAAVLQFAEWVQEFSLSAIGRNLKRETEGSRALASAFNVIKWFISFAIWTVALLLILDNVGADVTALLAGLGIGGIAIGIAAQGVFRDLFSSLSIVIDKPFQVGDTVRYGDSWGAIEDIGLKSTRVRARSGEQLIISNTNMLEFEIHNMARMVRRRIETGFGVVYQTAPDMAEMIPDIVAKIVKAVPGVEFDRCGLSSFGASSLDYTLVFYSLHPDYNRSMMARSRVLLALFRAFRDQDIEFAYPTQTLFIEGDEATDPSSIREIIVAPDE